MVQFTFMLTEGIDGIVGSLAPQEVNVSLMLDEGTTVHCRIVGVRHEAKLLGARPVIEFQVLDEGPYFGTHLIGKPERKLPEWISTILGYSRAFVDGRVQPERILNHSCRVVVGLSAGWRPRIEVQDVLEV